MRYVFFYHAFELFETIGKSCATIIFRNLCKNAGSKQCCSHSNLSVDAICEANLLLVLCFAPRGLISSCTPVLLTTQKSTFPNSNSTRMAVLPPTRYLFIYFSYLFLVFVVVFLTEHL